MRQYFHWLILVIISCILGLIVSHIFNVSPEEVITVVIASTALYRTCKED